MEITKKISVKTVVGGPKELRTMMGTLPAYLIMQVFGEVTDIEQGLSDFKDEEGNQRPWTCLLGQFKARNLDTRKEYFAGRCFLPSVILDMLVANFKIGKAKGFPTLQFACQLGIKANEDIATGYEYYATSLMPPDANTDPFQAIEAKVKLAAEGLPSPIAPEVANPGGVKEPKDMKWGPES